MKAVDLRPGGRGPALNLAAAIPNLIEKATIEKQISNTESLFF
ncbi:hypothetical protein D1AOALGA4SA_5748 [Olavius algarvensis Delta 1 endosymbiont]|nr:hypothetical protein D1AOALGA4SA_5748 [Olavius algarvensis Delta 1 endosymbiont]